MLCNKCSQFIKEAMIYMENSKFIKYMKDILPGLLVSVVVAIVGMFIARFVPKLGAGTISIFLGMFVGNLFLNQDIFQKGYKSGNF